jgi:DNA gyrase subunit B
MIREGLTAIISVRLLNLNLKDKLKRNLEREVVSPVSQAVSEMIENYLEENPNDARIIVQKVILAA